nr:hypothetical protein [Tanacetum cinerariifolium]
MTHLPIALQLQQPKRKSTTDQYIFQRRTPVTEEAYTGPLAQHKDDTYANIVCDTPSSPNAETGAEVEISDSEGDTKILNVGEEKGKDVSNTVALEERTVELDEGQHTTEKHVFSENPPSSSGILSSMKNLDDAFTYSDQFLYDKPMEEEPHKANVETEVESMVTVPIHQASLTVPPLSTPIIDLTQPKQVSPPNQEPKNKVTQALSSKILTLKNHELYSKIDKDDNIFSTIKVVSRHQDTQQYEAILPIELTNEDIKNTTAYKEYYAYATGVAAPKPKASARKKRGDSDTSLTPPIATPTPITTAAPVPRLSVAAKGKQPTKAKGLSDLSKVARTEAEQLKIVLRRSRQETHISQHGGSSTNEGTGSKLGVSDVPSDESEEEISLNSFDDEDVDAQDEGDKNDESDDRSDDGNDDDNDEAVKDESGRGGDEVTESEGKSDKEETRQEEEESFDPIPRNPKGSEDEGNDEEDQDIRLSEEARIQEEEKVDELYRDVDINQGRGLQVSQH